MNSTSKTVASNGPFSAKVMELRVKIHDAEYVESAVQRIAQVLSRKIVEDNEQRMSGRKNESK